MAYALSLYRPRFPATEHNITLNGERYYSVSLGTSRYYDFWVSPRTRRQISEGAAPVVMGTKASWDSGYILSIAHHSSSAYQSTTSSSGWTNYANVNLLSLGIQEGQEFNLELVIDASRATVFVDGLEAATITPPLDGYVRISSMPGSSYVSQMRFRSSYETNLLEERLGNWKFHELTPVLLPEQPFTLGQLLGSARISETTAVNFRLNPEPLSNTGRVVAMQLRHDYSHRRQSARGGEAQFYYEGVDIRTLNMGLTGADSTSFSTDRTDMQTDLSKTDLGSVVHQIRYTLTPNAFDPLA